MQYDIHLHTCIHMQKPYTYPYIYVMCVCVQLAYQNTSKYFKSPQQLQHFAFEILKHLFSCCIFLLLCPCPVDAARCSGGVALGVAVVGVHAVHAVHAVAERSSSWLQMSNFCGNTCLCVAIPCKTIQYNTILPYNTTMGSINHNYNTHQNHSKWNQIPSIPQDGSAKLLQRMASGGWTFRWPYRTTIRKCQSRNCTNVFD